MKSIKWKNHVRHCSMRNQVRLVEGKDFISRCPSKTIELDFDLIDFNEH